MWWSSNGISALIDYSTCRDIVVWGICVHLALSSSELRRPIPMMARGSGPIASIFVVGQLCRNTSAWRRSSWLEQDVQTFPSLALASQIYFSTTRIYFLRFLLPFTSLSAHLSEPRATNRILGVCSIKNFFSSPLTLQINSQNVNHNCSSRLVQHWVLLLFAACIHSTSYASWLSACDDLLLHEILNQIQTVCVVCTRQLPSTTPSQTDCKLLPQNVLPTPSIWWP